MAKDMHKEEWDSATLTKLKVFEQYIHDWLNVTLNYGNQNKSFQTLEIYDLFCGSGYDGTKTQKGSPLIILDAVLKRNRKDKTIKIYFNDNDENKVEQLRSTIAKEYPNLKDKNIEVKYISSDTKDFKVYSKNYYKLIFLDQYGIQHINKVKEFLCNGTDILIFISSGHCRRFVEEKSFKQYLNSEHISKEDFEGKTSYQTHRVIAEYFKKLLPDSFIAPFSLIKDNNNINGLIFISTHRKGQEQFLKTAWKIDTDLGEGNINIDKDFSREEGSLFYDKNIPTQKEEEYQKLLLDFLREKRRDNIEIKNFGLDNGFLTTHTAKFLKEMQDDLECKYCNNANSGFHLSDKEIKVYIGLNNETD